MKSFLPFFQLVCREARSRCIICLANEKETREKSTTSKFLRNRVVFMPSRDWAWAREVTLLLYVTLLYECLMRSPFIHFFMCDFKNLCNFSGKMQDFSLEHGSQATLLLFIFHSRSLKVESTSIIVRLVFFSFRCSIQFTKHFRVSRTQRCTTVPYVADRRRRRRR